MLFGAEAELAEPLYCEWRAAGRYDQRTEEEEQETGALLVKVVQLGEYGSFDGRCLLGGHVHNWNFIHVRVVTTTGRERRKPETSIHQKLLCKHAWLSWWGRLI
jgi:hypothetical protein